MRTVLFSRSSLSTSTRWLRPLRTRLKVLEPVRTRSNAGSPEKDQGAEGAGAFQHQFITGGIDGGEELGHGVGEDRRTTRRTSRHRRSHRPHPPAGRPGWRPPRPAGRRVRSADVRCARAPSGNVTLCLRYTFRKRFQRSGFFFLAIALLLPLEDPTLLHGIHHVFAVADHRHLGARESSVPPGLRSRPAVPCGCWWCCRKPSHSSFRCFPLSITTP